MRNRPDRRSLQMTCWSSVRHSPTSALMTCMRILYLKAICQLLHIAWIPFGRFCKIVEGLLHHRLQLWITAHESWSNRLNHRGEALTAVVCVATRQGILIRWRWGRIMCRWRRVAIVSRILRISREDWGLNFGNEGITFISLRNYKNGTEIRHLAIYKIASCCMFVMRITLKHVSRIVNCMFVSYWWPNELRKRIMLLMRKSGNKKKNNGQRHHRRWRRSRRRIVGVFAIKGNGEWVNGRFEWPKSGAVWEDRRRLGTFIHICIVMPQ